MKLSSLGYEFVALRVFTELVEDLRYKIRCFGVPLYGTSNIFCNNKSVVTNVSVRISMSNKQNNDICYYRVRESQALGNIQGGWNPSERNLEYLLTKTTIYGNVRH